MLKPLPLTDQIAALRSYMRTLRADSNRTYREQAKHWRKRRVTPFVEQLRYQRSRNASELVEAAEECLGRLRHVQALADAEFFPGTQIAMEVVMSGHERPPERFVIYDVEWSRSIGYVYQAWQLTKNGELFKRGPALICPSRHIKMTRVEQPLSHETIRRADYFREAAEEFIRNATQSGKIDDVLKIVGVRRARRGY
jgi:hypothetical protein